MSKTFWDQQQRVVFQHGVVWEKNESGLWRCLGTVPDAGEISIDHMTRVLNLKPVLVVPASKFPDFPPMVLPYHEGRVLEIQVSEAEQSVLKSGFDTISGSDYFALSYNARCVLYHFSQLAETYARIVRSYTSVPFPREHDRVQYQGQMEPFFEFDALITACIRMLDALRRPIWKLYGNVGSLPSSFHRVLNACKPGKKMPQAIYQQLSQLKNDCFDEAKEYRDCIQHYFAPGTQRSFAIMERLEPGIWSMTAWLPDEPARSLNEFKFKRRIDALDYTWNLSTRVIEAMTLIVGEVVVQRSTTALNKS